MIMKTKTKKRKKEEPALKEDWLSDCDHEILMQSERVNYKILLLPLLRTETDNEQAVSRPSLGQKFVYKERDQPILLPAHDDLQTSKK